MQVRLKHLCASISRGSTPSYAEDGDVIVVGQSCQRPGGTFDLSRARTHAGPVPTKGQLRGGEVLINSTGTGTLGRSALVSSSFDRLSAFADSHVTVVRFRADRADNRFMAYLLGRRAMVEYFEDALAVGATKQQELNVEAIRRLALAVPPIEAQHAIGGTLDGLCVNIDRSIAQAGGTLASALTTYRDSLIHEAVTGKLDVTRVSDAQMDERLHAAVEGRLDEVGV